jgi:hypothetical protein
MAVGFFGKLLFKGKNVGRGEAIKKVDVATDLKKKRKFQDDITKRRDEILSDYKITDPKQKIELRKSANQPKINKRMAEIQDEGRVKKGKELFRTNKAKGGRIGYKMGTPKKETNVQKIKKTFGKGLGMQSVIYGLDKNPKITAADPKAKFIAAANKKKKKI